MRSCLLLFILILTLHFTHVIHHFFCSRIPIFITKLVIQQLQLIFDKLRADRSFECHHNVYSSTPSTVGLETGETGERILERMSRQDEVRVHECFTTWEILEAGFTVSYVVLWGSRGIPEQWCPSCLSTANSWPVCGKCLFLTTWC